MKKTLATLLVVIISLAFTVGLASCTGDVEFDVNFIVDGEVYDTVSTSGKTVIKIPDNPTKEGYTFDGWYWDNEVWEKPFTANSLFDTPLSSDMSVYAKWKSNVHVHTPSEWIEDKAATCKETGAKHKECTECNEVIETDIINKLTTHTPVTDARVEPTTTTTGLTEGSHCSVCGTVLVEQDIIPMLQSATTLISGSLNVDGRNISGSFDYSTTTFNFAEDVTVTNNCKWVLSTDMYGMHIIAAKITPLNEGNNIFYIHVTNTDQTISLYTVNIYRNKLCEVSFNTNGGSTVASQFVEEGNLATCPSSSRLGYDFVSWDYDFSQPITNSITVNAEWTPRNDTKYKVEYYLENVEDHYFTLLESETEELTGTTDTTANAELKEFDNFTLVDWSYLSGNIQAEGTLTLKVYYSRNSHTVTCSDTTNGSVVGTGTYKHGSSVTLTANTFGGYEVLGWYSGGTLLSSSKEYTFTLNDDLNIEAKFGVKEEMENFIFTSDATNCKITGIKDKTVTKIIVPDYVTDISEGAFSGCSYLESITIPFVGTSNLLSEFIVEFSSYDYLFGSIFGTSWYSGAQLTKQEFMYDFEHAYYEAYIPSSLRSVTVTQGNKFYDDNEGISISKTNVITYGSFNNCSNITSITLGDGIRTVEGGVFDGCTNLQYSEYDNAYYLGNKNNSYLWLIKARSTDIFSCEIHSDTKFVAEYAFSGCNLIEVINYSSLNIVAGEYSYGEVAINAIEVHNGESKIVNKEDFIFYAHDGINYLVGYVGNETALALPENYNGQNYEIYKLAFYRSNLVSVIISDGVTKIGDSAFESCGSLTNAKIGDSVKSIGDYAFSYCVKLNSVTIGKGVTSIGYHAFYDCWRLSNIYYRGTETEWLSISKGWHWNVDAESEDVINYTMTYNYTEE